MGAQCSTAELPRVGTCIDESRQTCGIFDEDMILQEQSNKKQHIGVSQKGLVIYAESVDDLVRALPFELDADLEHLYLLPGSSSTGAPCEPLNYKRDLGVCCEGPAGVNESAENQDNYICLQVDDLANPWGLYAVADGRGPHGHLVSALLVHEIPGLLLGNPAMHQDSSLAFYQTFVSAGEMVSTCQYVDSSASASTCSAVLLRDGVLHVAWIGNSKVVLGRIAGRKGVPGAADTSFSALSPPGRQVLSRDRRAQRNHGRDGILPPAPEPLQGAPRPPAVVGGASGAVEPTMARAVELTAENMAKGDVDSQLRSSSACGGGTGEAHSADDLGYVPVVRRMFGRTQVGPASCAPEVRRLRLKAEDIFLILGTEGLWKWLSPAEVVKIVGENAFRPAEDAADAVVQEVYRRRMPGDVEDLTVLVIYLQGECFVQHGLRGDSGPTLCRSLDTRLPAQCLPT